MATWQKLRLRLDPWGNATLDGEELPRPGEHVRMRIRDQKVFIVPDSAGEEPADVTYIWPHKEEREETAQLAWRHLEQRLRKARITDHYPCCGGDAIFFPTWLSLALDSYIELAEERICPACGRYWTVEAVVKDRQVEEVVWLYRSRNKKRSTV